MKNLDTSTGRKSCVWRVTGLVLALAFVPAALLAAGADSPRLARAKDLIADEQWRRAVIELRAAYADPREPAQDEAAFWLAHSLYRSGDAGGALQTIRQMEQRFPRSRWIYPARSLQLEIAHRLNRSDVLWKFAAPPAPPAIPAEPVDSMDEIPAPPAPAPSARPTTAPHPPASPGPRALPVPPASPTIAPRPRREWVRSLEAEDLDLRIQALGSLMRVEPARAVPILKEVALATEDEEQARRAIFVLMQSNRIDARAAVREIAKTGPEVATLAAVKELGLAPAQSARLLRELYASGSSPVKAQVLRAFGSGRQVQPLLQIVRTEREPVLREAAVAALGQAGARPQLARLYRQHPDLRLPVITALFTAAGEPELEAIAKAERDPKLRAEAQARLALFK